jgi:hypothetical protein
VIETPAGVRVIKFKDFEPRKAMVAFEAIREADSQIQNGICSRKADDAKEGPSDPKRVLGSVSV